MIVLSRLQNFLPTFKNDTEALAKDEARKMKANIEIDSPDVDSGDEDTGRKEKDEKKKIEMVYNSLKVSLITPLEFVYGSVRCQ